MEQHVFILLTLINFIIRSKHCTKFVPHSDGFTLAVSLPSSIFQEKTQQKTCGFMQQQEKVTPWAVIITGKKKNPLREIKLLSI